MFDIGFSEIIVCAIVALIVIGPERMPEAVRTVGLWIGRFKRSLRETRVEIERQIGVDDIRRQLHNEDIMRSLENARRDIHDVIEQTQQDIDIEERTKSRVYTQETALPDHAHTTESEPVLPQAHQKVEKLSPPEKTTAVTPAETKSPVALTPTHIKTSL